MHSSLKKDFIFKSTFKHKLAQLKLNGIKLEILEMVKNWLQDNVDDLIK